MYYYFLTLKEIDGPWLWKLSTIFVADFELSACNLDTHQSLSRKLLNTIGVQVYPRREEGSFLHLYGNK